MKTTAFLFATLPILVLSTDTGFAAAVNKRVCKALINATGQHKVKPLAIKMSKQNWANQAKAIYGSGWSSLSNAQVQQSSCNWVNPEWRCVYNARPCRWESTLPPSQHAPSLLKNKKPKPF